jgi:hypothetical protein
MEKILKLGYVTGIEFGDTAKGPKVYAAGTPK